VNIDPGVSTAASGMRPYRFNLHRSQIEEESIDFDLPGFKFNFFLSRFLSGSRAWKFHPASAG
jgi:hypothetical protein